MIKNKETELVIEQLKELLIRFIKQSKDDFCIKEFIDELLSTDTTIAQSRGQELFSLLVFVNDFSSQLGIIIDDQLNGSLTQQENETLLTAFGRNTHVPFLTTDTVKKLGNKSSFSAIQTLANLSEWLGSPEAPTGISTIQLGSVETNGVCSLLENDKKGLALLSRLKKNDRFDKELVWTFIEEEVCYELVIKLIKELDLVLIDKLLAVHNN